MDPIAPEDRSVPVSRNRRALVAGTAASLLSVSGLVAAEYLESSAGVWIFKPLASLGFVAVALIAGALDPGRRYGRFILAGLILSLAGDVLLIPGWLLAGLTAFLLGHLAYIGAFFVRGLHSPTTAGTFVLLTLPGLGLATAYLPDIEEGLQIPVVLYGVVITTMVALAAGTVSRHGRWTILAGALLFYLSDLSVARDAFILPEFLNKAWGLPAYYAGQLLLAWSVAPRPEESG